MAETNLATRTMKYFPHPIQDAQPQVPGKMGAIVLHGPHSMADGADGKCYTTNSFSIRVGVYNPKTMQWDESIKIGGKALFPTPFASITKVSRGSR